MTRPHTSRLPLKLALLLATIAGGRSVARADDVTDDMTAVPAVTSTIQSLAKIACSGQLPGDQAEHDKTELRRNFWAFMPDVKLEGAELSHETDRFDAMWRRMLTVSQNFGVKQVSFVGCDTLALAQCDDLYFVSFTPRGPVLFRFSVEFNVGDRARLFGFETITGWDNVKQAVAAIQHPVSPGHVPTITATPATQPAGGTSSNAQP